MKQTWKESLKSALASRPLQYVAVGLVVLLIVYLYGRSTGKTVRVTYPKSSGQDGLSNEFTQNSAPKLIQALFDALDGVSVDTYKKYSAILGVLYLTDNQLVYINNQYNYLHQTPGGTLYNALKNEWMGYSVGFEDAKQELLTRLRQLGAN